MDFLAGIKNENRELCMKLSVLMPVWNEGATLLEILYSAYRRMRYNHFLRVPSASGGLRQTAPRPCFAFAVAHFSLRTIAGARRSGRKRNHSGR